MQDRALLKPSICVFQSQMNPSYLLMPLAILALLHFFLTWPVLFFIAQILPVRPSCPPPPTHALSWSLSFQGPWIWTKWGSLDTHSWMWGWGWWSDKSPSPGAEDVWILAEALLWITCEPWAGHTISPEKAFPLTTDNESLMLLSVIAMLNSM